METLENVDVLLCEDTRKTGLLLQSLKIANKPKLESFYDEVEQQKIPKIVEMLKEGLEVGLVTDAGTPLISDPGWLLVKKCRELGIKYTAVPGACAVIDAAVLSGLPIQRFCFLGFLPKKEGDIKKLLNRYKDFEGVKVAYEAGNRLKESMEIIKEVFGEKVEIRIIREMTKIHEEVLKSEELANDKGEAVLVWS
jgi:16S rRNA (cytidine1402-2'-O)-methyltransferase